MDSKTRFDLITRNLDEVLTPQDLQSQLDTGVPMKHYIGFEISGHVHLGTGLSSGQKIADFQRAKVDCSIYLASYHAWINNKLDGELETIRRVAVGYFKEGMKVSLECAGADPEKVKFVTGDELYHHNDLYWQTVIDVSKQLTLNRALRSITIMGRKEGENVSLSSLFYAPMQVADIFIQDLNLAHSGMDQRKAQVIAREVAESLHFSPLKRDGKTVKPIALHHHLLLGLQKPSVWPVPKEELQELWSSMKMSKSVPNSAVFVHDSEEEIRSKLNKAFCMEKEVEFNPVLDWAKHLVFSKDKAELPVERPAKFGGSVTYASYAELESDFVAGKLHPMDLKSAMAEKLIKILAPARKRFSQPKFQKMKEELVAIKDAKKA